MPKSTILEDSRNVKLTFTDIKAYHDEHKLVSPHRVKDRKAKK